MKLTLLFFNKAFLYIWLILEFYLLLLGSTSFVRWLETTVVGFDDDLNRVAKGLLIVVPPFVGLFMNFHSGYKDLSFQRKVRT
jgi:hypothetical protein